LHYIYYKKKINLQSPKTIIEKIQWLKFNYYKDNELIKRCADKYLVRDYVKEVGCKEILTELIAVYNNASEIQWDELPNKFALKWNFGNGMNIICKDKNKLNVSSVIQKLNKWERFPAHLKAYEP